MVYLVVAALQLLAEVDVDVVIAAAVAFARAVHLSSCLSYVPDISLPMSLHVFSREG